MTEGEVKKYCLTGGFGWGIIKVEKGIIANIKIDNVKVKWI